jgi:nucleoside 2-deoxyribosyltransferase
MEALLITPFDPSATALRDTIQMALEDVGVRVKMPDLEPGADFSGVITDAITSADLVIADVSRKNPNVFYELGYAHALRKNTILLVSKDATPELPFDLAGMYYHSYDPHNLRELGDYLRHRVTGLKQRREALA